MTKIEVAEKLKQARIACGLTQKAVADAIGKSPKLVGHWETGYSQPDADMLSALLRLYNVDANVFFDITPAPTDTQRPDEEQRLVIAYRQASREDQLALLRFADYATRAVKEAGTQTDSSAAERTAPAVPPAPRLSRAEEIKIAMEALDAYIGSQGQSHEGTE